MYRWLFQNSTMTSKSCRLLQVARAMVDIDSSVMNGQRAPGEICLITSAIDQDIHSNLRRTICWQSESSMDAGFSCSSSQASEPTRLDVVVRGVVGPYVARRSRCSRWSDGTKYEPGRGAVAAAGFRQAGRLATPAPLPDAPQLAAAGAWWEGSCPPIGGVRLMA